jgi:hypothetical protein
METNTSAQGRTAGDAELELRLSAETVAGASSLVRKNIVAQATSVSARTIENWMRSKRIPFIRLSPRCVRFDLQRVLAALRRFEVKEVTRAK